MFVVVEEEEAARGAFVGRAVAYHSGQTYLELADQLVDMTHTEPVPVDVHVADQNSLDPRTAVARENQKVESASEG